MHRAPSVFRKNSYAPEDPTDSKAPRYLTRKSRRIESRLMVGEIDPAFLVIDRFRVCHVPLVRPSANSGCDTALTPLPHTLSLESGAFLSAEIQVVPKILNRAKTPGSISRKSPRRKPAASLAEN